MAEAGTGQSLIHAKLEIHEPPLGYSTTPGAVTDEFEFDFNPSQLVLSRRALWKTTPTAAVRDGALPEFLGPEPRAMDVDVFLDNSHDPGGTDLLKKVELLFSCCEVTENSINAKQPSTPWVVFQWGSFTTVRFTAFVGSVTASYTLFSSTGVPIRARCKLSLNEIPTKTAGQNPTSGALTAHRVHRLIAGDSLQSLAWREYGNAGAWRAIAEANGIDDPARVRPGTELVLPAAEEVSR